MMLNSLGPKDSISIILANCFFSTAINACGLKLLLEFLFGYFSDSEFVMVLGVKKLVDQFWDFLKTYGHRLLIVAINNMLFEFFFLNYFGWVILLLTSNSSFDLVSACYLVIWISGMSTLFCCTYLNENVIVVFSFVTFYHFYWKEKGNQKNKKRKKG